MKEPPTNNLVITLAQSRGDRTACVSIADEAQQVSTSDKSPPGKPKKPKHKKPNSENA